MSEQKTLNEALASIQALGLKAKESGKNPHYNSTYSELEDVWEVLRKPLMDNDIVVTQLVEIPELPQNILVTTATHIPSGTAIKSTIPLITSKDDMQGLGSAITYARRYALSAMFNIVTSDDDGNGTVGSAPKQAHATPKQIGMISGLMEKQGAVTTEDKKQLLKEVAGVDSSSDLTVTTASQAIKKLQESLGES